MCKTERIICIRDVPAKLNEYWNAIVRLNAKQHAMYFWNTIKLSVFPYLGLSISKFRKFYLRSGCIIRSTKRKGLQLLRSNTFALVDRLQFNFWIVCLFLTRVELRATPLHFWILFPTDSIISFLSISWIICSPIHAFTRTQNYLIRTLGSVNR